MTNNIFIPKKIKVGYQNRDDTYTKRLAYVIYYDEKDILRKETSWNSWCDNKIEPDDYENIPTVGFVLNKKVGDYCSDWNHRQAYVRVYDSRDFEFEITIENLLYILENASSIKGKGLEGEFIYGWDGKDLLLMPIASPDYAEISKYNEIVQANNHLKAKELILGATYMTKSNEEWIYMGRFDYYYNKSERIEMPSTNFYKNYTYKHTNINKGKYHYFVRECKYYNNSIYLQTLKIKSPGSKFISTISTECVENYAELFEKLECTTDYSPLDESKDEYIAYTFDEFAEKIVDRGIYCYSQKKSIHINKVYDKPNLFYFEYDSDYLFRKNKTEGTIKEIYDILQPTYKNEYLKNGKLYKEGK